MQIAAITDHSFTTPDIERAIIEPLGCSVISQQAFTDQDALIELVCDADYVITQFAPVNAEVIDCMQKCTIIVRYGIGVDNVDLSAAESIAAMKDGALLVNVARGTLVDTDDLAAALRSGKLAGAALDVTDPEPIDPRHPLVGMDNVVITSHVASVSEPSGRKLRTSVANTVAAAIRGEKLPNVVNGVSA